ncbi:acyl-CoA synthetase [Phaeovibrio sulfidiphilus]|uniref:3-methylmercaptopropionyl-CoA ligase n=1 Tax=Phaeovibrio sulfidiphilus TaxID=1220600 RepID=A0A8J6YNQ5_9PROT|nr:acyl-CoA synthetase [Phaeovibrio sulfidiphilus]MBE1237149.1 acyl-CoA synthetase [Phaeovibrio sulfidiphilus]
MNAETESIYTTGLQKNRANHSPMTPLSMIERTAEVFPDLPAVIHGSRSFTWEQTYERSRRLASALRKLGVGKHQTVSVLLSNTPEMIECHFGVPGCGAVLNTINTRLDPETIAFILGHGEARVLITDREFSSAAEQAVRILHNPNLVVIDVDDPEYTGEGKRIGRMTYEELLATGDPREPLEAPDDEWDAIALNYTSGTTGNPKGVVYHHRGAYLGAMAQLVNWAMPHHPVYLWTVPMFHCNGWTFPWAIAAHAGVNICLRRVDAATIWDLIRRHRVTHYCAAPIVHKTIAEVPDEMREGVSHTVRALFGGAPPPRSVLVAMERIGFELTQIYGLTETYGPVGICARHPRLATADFEERLEFATRQGVRGQALDAISVRDPLTLDPVPWDGKTMGEIMFRGNLVMKGYLKNPTATDDAFEGGWFRSGDLAVTMPDGYIHIRDRSKDVIISGGENISSIEVENAIYTHPAVSIAAVVAAPDEKWGETPCAFIELRPGMEVTEEEILEHCRQHLAGYKMPKQIYFETLPRTATGKIQKYMLRQQVNSRASFG